MNSEEEFYDAETGLESDDSLDISFKDPLGFESAQQVADGSAAEHDAVWRRRKSLPAETITRTNFSVTSILKKCIGMELSKIAMPVVFNEPLSFLQRLSEYMEHSHLIHRACGLPDSVDRMQVVAAFAVSAIASQSERTGKPFNPLLGETFELTREEDGYRLISEQVSHHPPVSAFHAESLKQEFAFHGSIYPKLKFWGKSVEAEPKGTMTLELLKHKEAYTWSYPMCCVHNVLIGKLWIEQYGTVEIVNHSTGEKCVLNFRPCGMFGKELHKVEGYIQDDRKKKRRVIYGKWTECMYSVEPKVHEAHKKSEKKGGADSKKPRQEHSCEDGNAVQETVTVIPGSALLWRISPRPAHSAQMYNFTNFAVTLNELEPGTERLLAPTDSRRRPDIRAMESGDIDSASAEKERLEEKQRAARRGRLKDEEEWSTRWFELGTNPHTGADDWLYKGGYFDRNFADCPDIY
ncbi:oxysterol-binding protein-related protein 2-like [Syngnathoides biaculeatus]|uniref:oxysterol-binding protein-related protein 2-like n=1 Tax=Syngnathoides biaculeatus TaxID=300417 RepID=UPI002ADDB6DE|nr:oxysterol-binding protein-related protein 2-like [Syngnathoides biaculeatus]XP_061702733.1 oxysterol-binding protein-related protein 2-like [Syngnathoides biaculeatus]